MLSLCRRVQRHGISLQRNRPRHGLKSRLLQISSIVCVTWLLLQSRYAVDSSAAVSFLRAGDSLSTPKHGSQLDGKEDKSEVSNPNDNVCRRWFQKDDSTTSPPLPKTCGHLKLHWLKKLRRQSSSTTKSEISMLVDEMQRHQSNCSAPTMRFDVDNSFGLGSHLVLWSQALCNAWESGHRIQTDTPPDMPWLWLDQGQCRERTSASYVTTSTTPLQCYFHNAEQKCPNDKKRDALSLPAVADPRDRKLFCKRLLEPRRHGKNDGNTMLRQFRTASFRYLFQHLSPVVVHEAERQVGLLFENGQVPRDMIAVHVRWGDKFWEMDLPPMAEYMKAIRQVLERRQKRRKRATEATISATSNSTLHIYLSTEDPRALDEFESALKNETWTKSQTIRLYVDRTIRELNEHRPTKGNRASWTARNTKGRAGLVALGSLLVALEATDWIVTTQSNWSRLWVALVGDGDDQVRVIDLRPGDW